MGYLISLPYTGVNPGFHVWDWVSVFLGSIYAIVEKVGDRLEGHFVLGHVDGVGIIKKIQKKPKEVQVWFKIPKNLSKYVVNKGSIAIDCNTQ